VFPLSDSARFMTGQGVNVIGGAYMTRAHGLDRL